MSFGGSILYAIGGDGEMTSLSNCFVIDSPDDSIAGIMNTLEQTAQLSKRRGGVGFATPLPPTKRFSPAPTKSNQASTSTRPVRSNDK